MPPTLSRRLRGFIQSDIRRMSRECERVGGINLGQGICDLRTEELVQEGAIEAIRASRATYSKFEGIDPLRQKIAAKIARYNGFQVDPATEIVVTVGSTGGFAASALATLDAGDEVILFEPYYGYHVNTLRALDVKTRLIPLAPPDWAIDLGALRAAFEGGAKGIVVCTPSNPCGKVFTRDELQAIASLCREFGAWAYTDEIYEYIVFDGRRHVSLASLEGARERTITISGFSKTFSITGWRVGYVAAAPEVAAAIGLMNDLFYVCAPTPLQWGVARGLDAPDSYYTALASDYEAKRDMLADAVAAAGMVPFVPQGAYYMLADAAPLGAGDGSAVAASLLEQARVAAIPGTAFYESARGASLLRFCFAKDFDALEEACRRIRGFRPATRAR